MDPFRLGLVCLFAWRLALLLPPVPTLPEEIVFVGTGNSDAAAYDPDTDSWRRLISPDEGLRYDPSKVWADGAVLVWGGNRSYEGIDLRVAGVALRP